MRIQVFGHCESSRIIRSVVDALPGGDILEGFGQTSLGATEITQRIHGRYIGVYHQSQNGLQERKFKT